MPRDDQDILPAMALAATGYNAYSAAFPAGTLAWQQIGEEAAGRWLQVAAFLRTMPPEIDGLAWQDAAALAWHVSRHGSPSRHRDSIPAWRCLLEGERVAWEAAVRHMVAIVDSGLPDEELETIEQSWAAWAMRRRAPVTPVLETLDAR